VRSGLSRCLYEHPEELSDLIDVVARLPFREPRPRESRSERPTGSACARRSRAGRSDSSRFRSRRASDRRRRTRRRSSA
jgi:hypothetical protein